MIYGDVKLCRRSSIHYPLVYESGNSVKLITFKPAIKSIFRTDTSAVSYLSNKGVKQIVDGVSNTNV